MLAVSGSRLVRNSIRQRMFASGRRQIGIASLILVAWLVPGTSLAAGKGDVNLDCEVNGADVVLLFQRLGGVTLMAEQETAANVGPAPGGVSTPDAVVDVADLIVLMRSVAGLVGLAPRCPFLTAPTESQTTVNPEEVSGTATPGIQLTLYVNGVAQQTLQADPLDGIRWTGASPSTRSSCTTEPTTFTRSHRTRRTTAGHRIRFSSSLRTRSTRLNQTSPSM